MYMRFDIAIERGTATTAWGVVVPALPGCFSAGDSLEEAMANARQAIALHIEALHADGKNIPPTQSSAALQADPEFAGWMWASVDVQAGKSAAHPGAGWRRGKS